MCSVSHSASLGLARSKQHAYPSLRLLISTKYSIHHATPCASSRGSQAALETPYVYRKSIGSIPHLYKEKSLISGKCHCIQGGIVGSAIPPVYRENLADPVSQSKDTNTRGLESTSKKGVTLNANGSKSSFAPSDARDQAALGTA